MKHFITILSVIFLISIFACKGKQASPKVVSEKENIEINPAKKSTEEVKKTILCFGNSLTAGYGLDEQYAWPSLLQKQIDSLAYDYKVINAGLSGETTSGGLNRIDWVLSQKVDIFILELGANDMLRGLNFESTEENLKQILRRVKAANPDVRIIIAGILSPPNMGPEYEKSFNSMYPKLAKSHDAKLIPFFLQDVAGIEDLNLPDGKHPNKKGQKIVLANVWNQLEGLL